MSQVDGHRPVGSRCRRIPVADPDGCSVVIRARCGNWDATGVPADVASELTLHDIANFRDYDQPGSEVRVAL